MSGFSCKLGSMMAAFLDYRSALGYSRRHFHDALRSLDKFILAEYPDEESLTGDIVTDWVTAQVGNQDQKTSCVRLFAEYLNSIGQTAYVFPRGHKRPRRATSSGKSETAYIFTDDELRRLFAAIDEMPVSSHQPMMREMFSVMMRLTYTCGLRPNESRMLKHEDVNWTTGTVLITKTKHKKERIVVMSPDMLARANADNAITVNGKLDERIRVKKATNTSSDPDDTKFINKTSWNIALSLILLCAFSRLVWAMKWNGKSTRQSSKSTS